MPRLSLMAPVNAPFTWPNSSDSISSSGRAAEFTSTNGPVRRWLRRWTWRATSSFPVPFSPSNQHTAVGRCGHRDLFAQPQHDAALADNRVAPIDARTQRAVLGLQLTLPQRVADHEHRLLERQRLLDEIERPQFRRANGRLDAAVARNHDHRRFEAALSQSFERDQPVDARQPDVEQHQVVGLVPNLFQARFTTVDGVNGVPLVSKDSAERGTDTGFVVDD